MQNKAVYNKMHDTINYPKHHVNKRTSVKDNAGIYKLE